MLDTLGLALHGCLCLGPGLVLLLVAWATLRCCRSTSGKRHQVGGRLQASLSQEALAGQGGWGFGGVPLHRGMGHEASRGAQLGPGSLGFCSLPAGLCREPKQGKAQEGS